jgi:hypothetical protein
MWIPKYDRPAVCPFAEPPEVQTALRYGSPVRVPPAVRLLEWRSCAATAYEDAFGDRSINALTDRVALDRLWCNAYVISMFGTSMRTKK